MFIASNVQFTTNKNKHKKASSFFRQVDWKGYYVRIKYTDKSRKKRQKTKKITAEITRKVIILTNLIKVKKL